MSPSVPKNFTAEDARFMQRALALADEAALVGEVPVGAVVVHEGRVVGEGRNTRETAHDPLGHAELTALAAAARTLGRWRLSGCTLYVTLEPCCMCAGGIVHARVDRVVYGAVDAKAGGVESLYHLLSDPRLNHQPVVETGLFAAQASAQLRAFFDAVRARRKAEKAARQAARDALRAFGVPQL